MAKMCPISLSLVDERVARLNAALTVIFLGLYLLTPFKWVVWILAIDFFIRGFLKPSRSYFSALSRKIASLRSSASRQVDAGPKLFAAKIGFAFSCLLVLCQVAGWQAPGMVLACIFLLFAALEACCGFCVACRIYPLICGLK